MKIIVVQSGSKGNATLVIDQGRVLLIDMGTTLKVVKEALAKENMNLMNINAMLLTHEHVDHTYGIRYLPPLPIYCTKETLALPNIEEIEPYKTFKIEHFEITPVSTSHDVKNPVGFIIQNKKEKLVYLTDSGKISTKTLNRLKNANYYVIESNHDVEMLINSNRPWFLKKRILSDKGHLSNEQSATYMSKCVGENTKQIILAHLSEECNDPNVALKTYKKIFKDAKINTRKIKFIVANQYHSVEGGSK
jgi:phosphoribosyl 1,2-cyclic phosphodiesterase